MTASTASRHMYAIASWSPSQSEPRTVSNMCQRHSSFSIFPRAALMPPCAATVGVRVGKTLVMQAVFKPAATIPSVARSPAPPAPRTITSKEWSTISYALGILVSLSAEKELEQGEHAGAGEDHRNCPKEKLGCQQPGARVHIIENDRANTDQRMRDPDKNDENYEQGWYGRGKPAGGCISVRSRE